MAKILKVLRNNWKKSVLGFAAVSYGVVYAKYKYDVSQHMHQCCEQASAFGDSPLRVRVKPRKLTVFLNPAANGRKAKKQFEQFCAPILHLAGISVEVISTEHEGQVRTFMETFDGDADAIIVAGGDGTLSEAITGMLRRSESSVKAKNYTIGVLPLGRTNTIANSLFASNGSSNIDGILLLTKAAIAIVHEVTKPLDVIKVEVLQESENETSGKPVYSVTGVQWGAYRDALAKQDKYWYWSRFRKYATYLFTGLKSAEKVTWKCDAHLSYAMPCSGCSNCYKIMYYDDSVKSVSRWWHVFLPHASKTPPEKPVVDFKNVTNEECGKFHHQEVSTVELLLNTTNCCHPYPKNPKPHIEVSIGPEAVGYVDFVSEGWRRAEGNEPMAHSKLAVREIEIRPVLEKNTPEGKEQWMSIDLEEYELKPVHLTLLPGRVNIFCTSETLKTSSAE